MTTVGQVESLWRYPVKSMRGEQLQEAFVGFPGLYGDRVYAFRSAQGRSGFPWFTGREQAEMLRYRAVYRHPDRMRLPTNLREAEAIGSGVTPCYADPADQLVDVETPSGEVLAVDDPGLADLLLAGRGDGAALTVGRSERAMTDCRPISLFSIQTARQLSAEVGSPVDKRRFRANLYLDLADSAGFAENAWVGHRLRIGTKVEIAVLNRDNRCMMITLDPDTVQANPEIMRRVARDHDGAAGLYAAVLVEGVVRAGDEVTLLD